MHLGMTRQHLKQHGCPPPREARWMWFRTLGSSCVPRMATVPPLPPPVILAPYSEAGSPLAACAAASSRTSATSLQAEQHPFQHVRCNAAVQLHCIWGPMLLPPVILAPYRVAGSPRAACAAATSRTSATSLQTQRPRMREAQCIDTLSLHLWESSALQPRHAPAPPACIHNNNSQCT